MTKIKTHFREAYRFDNRIVTIERVENGSAGQPRYEVQLINLDLIDEIGDTIVKTYRFQGHYLTTKEEARWALKQYLKELGYLASK